MGPRCTPGCSAETRGWGWGLGGHTGRWIHLSPNLAASIKIYEGCRVALPSGAGPMVDQSRGLQGPCPSLEAKPGSPRSSRALLGSGGPLGHTPSPEVTQGNRDAICRPRRAEEDCPSWRPRPWPEDPELSHCYRDPLASPHFNDRKRESTPLLNIREAGTGSAMHPSGQLPPQCQVGPYNAAQSEQACISTLTPPAQPRAQQPALPSPAHPSPVVH